MSKSINTNFESHCGKEFVCLNTCGRVMLKQCDFNNKLCKYHFHDKFVN